MKFGARGLVTAALALFVLAGVSSRAHHAISAKFDDTKAATLTGIVTMVDWSNPHVHVFINVKTGNDLVN